MISAASAVTSGLLLAYLVAEPSTQYFFRMPDPWWPVGFAGAGFVISLIVGWCGSRRPGPRGPRIWVLGLLVANVALLAAGVYVALSPEVPPYLSDPFPLHPLSLSAFVGAFVLLPRLWRTHPLRYRVQLVGLVAVVIVAPTALLAAAVFIERQKTAERNTLVGMAEALDRVSAQLHQAARFQYSHEDALNGDSASADAALARLEPSETLNLPDARRWYAAALLEEENLLKKGRLEKSVNDYVDAVRAVFVTNTIPRLRRGRYRFDRGRKPAVNERPIFERPADIGLRYYAEAAKWLPSLAALRDGLAGAHSQKRLGEITAHIEGLKRQSSTFWWAALAEGHENASRPPAHLTAVFAMPIHEKVKPLSDLEYWSNLTWLRRRDLRSPTSTCVEQSAQVSNQRKIEVPYEELTDDQRQTGLVHYIGETFNVSGMVQCFAYHPPYGAAQGSEELVVLELRLMYDVLDLEVRAPAPCTQKCWRDPFMPAGALPSSIELFVDIPPSVADAAYGDVVADAFQKSTKTGARVAPEVISLDDHHRAVRLRIGRGAN